MNFLRLFQSESTTASGSTVLGGRYKVLRQLGAGGFGRTFLAEDLHLPGNPHCVVKRLHPQFTDAATLQTAKRLFDTEAQTLYALGNHSQIPKLLAHFEQDEEFYLVQELIEGHSLSLEVRDDHPWSEGQVVGLLRDILEVLAFVHQQHVIHRDIKPANLIRRHADRRVVLIDFGAVKQATTQLPDSTSASGLTISIGTPGYMPNEQLAGNPRFSSDVYAVGMIGIHALTGISPRSLPKNPHTSEIDWQQEAAVHPELAAVIDQMVRYDFRARYPTAAAALEAIAQVPIAPEPPPLRFPLSQRPVDSRTALEQTTVPTPESLERSQPAEVAPTEVSGTGVAGSGVAPTEVSGTGVAGSGVSATGVSATPTRPTETLPLRPIATGNQSAPFKFVRQPKTIGLLAAGMVGSILLASVIKPPSLPPASSPSATMNAAPAAPAIALLEQANQLRTQNQFQTAIQTYDRVLALDPNLPEAHWGRCYSLNSLQQFDAAIAACDAALKLKPNYAEALWSKGFALDQQGQEQAALELFEQAIAQKPDFAEAWVNKGATLMALNRSQEAIAAFDQAIALNENLPEAWSNRGKALWQLQQFEEGLASVDRALQIQPDSPEALKLQQQMRERLGKS